MDNVLAIDGDGVLLDYRQAYPLVWKKAFGEELVMKRPDAYHAHNAYGLTWKDKDQEKLFFQHFDDEAWSTMPAFEGVHEGCELLVSAGYRLVCVTSMNPDFEDARRRNFRALGLPIAEVHAVKRAATGNPKLAMLRELGALALVDDLPDNFEGLGAGTHRAYIDYGRYDAPGIGTPVRIDTRHANFLDFARYWVAPHQQAA